MTMRFLLVTVLCFLFVSTAAAAQNEKTVAGFTEEEVLLFGEKMYREGVLPSGEPMEALVMGDIPVDGRMFTCDDCHQRSGLGSVEGTVITWPTNGRELYRPRRKTGAWHQPESEEAKMDVRKNLPAYWEEIEEARPAYTDESLATVLWTGVDPTGRKLNPIMPLYHLEDSDMAIMVHYLKNLSVDLPPGVDDTTIRFATVVSEDIPAEAREAMLAILQAHVDVRNSQSRHQERRAESGPFYKTEMHQAYRRWELDIWKLQGPANTWSRQLREYYQKQPVFALLGGLAEGSWQPIHEFCEELKIPAIFPLTDFPVISESDWYTLYFSKGFYQEGEAAARYLHAQENIVSGTKIVMVSRQGMAGSYLNRGFSESWQVFGMPGPEHIKLAPDKKLSEQFWSDIMQAKQPDVLILWLEPVDLADISTLVEETKLPGKIILSAEMLNYSFTAIPDNLRDNVYLTYSYSLPDSQKRSKQAVKQWLRARKIPVTDLKMQSKMYFLGWMLAGAVKSMRSEFFRDYFLEGFDMMIDQDYAIAVYPRLTFGSGQRYASKGCYIVQLTKGPEPKLVEKSNWIIH